MYAEELSSPGTTALFAGLALFFARLAAGRRRSPRRSRLAAVFWLLAGFFVFYTANYRTLSIRLTPKSLALKFGVFAWDVPLENIADCRLDELPPLLRYGGAGVHGFSTGGRYRISFNFLEGPRLVIRLKRPAGPIQDISFSTRRPEALLAHLGTSSISPEILFGNQSAPPFVL